MILQGYYVPKTFNPLRQHALVSVLTQDATGYIVKGYDHTTWHADFDELEVLVQEEEDND